MNKEMHKRDCEKYEYHEVAIGKTIENIYVDKMKDFGWVVENINAEEERVIIKFKRNSGIRNKAQLALLQRSFESYVDEIELIKKENFEAQLISYMVGSIGTGIMAGALLAAGAKNILLCIILVVLGLAGWIMPWFVYKYMVDKKEKRINNFLEEKYNEINDICESANELVNKS